MAVFEDFDFGDFWSGSDYERKAYIGEALDDALVQSIERELGYKLPKSYIEFMSFQNGGIPKNSRHKVDVGTSWAEDHLAITGIYGIGRRPDYSLCGEVGSKFMMEEWGYPPIGVYFADTPSGGHDMLCLDFRNAGPDNEPPVVHVAQEDDFKITFVAPNFEKFIRGLRHKDSFPFEND
ncbi:SMI1/KNR4 family protein [Tateyamaria sp.]|uniref:SMI1/KNR4 family protein n=1 Tax=Tateyamaria sp. TaxID=1929288 RepID=UPI00329E8DFA